MANVVHLAPKPESTPEPRRTDSMLSRMIDQVADETRAGLAEHRQYVSALLVELTVELRAKQADEITALRTELAELRAKVEGLSGRLADVEGDPESKGVVRLPRLPLRQASGGAA
jgi:hypothetical protein